MPHLHGTVIEIEDHELSQNGNWYTRGILEDNEKILHDFVIFWSSESAVRKIHKLQIIDLVGKKDRTEGTFKANFMRDFKPKTYLQPNQDLSDKTYRGEDAIKGKKPIEYVMDILGTRLVNEEIKKISKTYSDMFISERQEVEVTVIRNKKEVKEYKKIEVFPKVNEYKELLNELVRIAKIVEEEQKI